jgi:hypothetical protein
MPPRVGLGFSALGVTDDVAELHANSGAIDCTALCGRRLVPMPGRASGMTRDAQTIKVIWVTITNIGRLALAG